MTSDPEHWMITILFFFGISICCQRGATEQIDRSFPFCEFLLSPLGSEKKDLPCLGKEPNGTLSCEHLDLSDLPPWLKRNPPTAPPTLPQPKMPRPAWQGSRPCQASRGWIQPPMRSGCRRCRPNRWQHNSCTCSRLQPHQLVECSLVESGE